MAASGQHVSTISPAISVVMATFNGARFVDAQLRSILEQLGPDDEIVVCDDASSDDTCERVRALGDSRIRLFCHPDRVGYVRNFERAVQHARGPLVFFADQDDIWLPGKVRTLTALLESSDCAASDAVVVDEDLNVIHPSFFRLRRARRFSAFALMLRPAIVGATMACRRAYIESLRPFPRDIPHDLWLSCNAALRHRLAISREALILYRRHGAVASTSGTERRRPIGRRLADRWILVSAILAHYLRTHLSRNTLSA